MVLADSPLHAQSFGCETIERIDRRKVDESVRDIALVDEVEAKVDDCSMKTYEDISPP